MDGVFLVSQCDSASRGQSTVRRPGGFRRSSIASRRRRVIILRRDPFDFIKENTMKRVITAASSLVLASSLFGCGAADQDPGQSPGETPESPALAAAQGGSKSPEGAPTLHQGM